VRQRCGCRAGENHWPDRLLRGFCRMMMMFMTGVRLSERNMKVWKVSVFLWASLACFAMRRKKRRFNCLFQPCLSSICMMIRIGKEQNGLSFSPFKSNSEDI
jgi:hypothetical protein